ncbi:MAG: cytochrome c biogenesis protein CcsA [Deltaproteobacteria bacterium]|nr:cytochrome c biogenesis protein CcsA [Deltaproteobacteria bacterium]
MPRGILLKFFHLLALVMMIAALYSIFIYSPVEKTMGIVQKIFYIHVPFAFLAFISFLITFVTAILYLYTRDLKWDVISACSVEVGLVFCTLVLLTGPIWAKPIWNVWWTWDPRLTTTLILWFVYMAYLLFRSVLRENQRAPFSAVYGIIGFINVPLTFFAVRLWRTIHPVVITSKGMNISFPMKLTLMLSFFSFCLLFLFILLSRVRLEKTNIRVEKLKQMVGNKHLLP